MLRRAKAVDIPFMVKGYEIGLRDGNFSQSAMQINAFFANTTTHKNVHSYIYEHNGAPAGYAVLRKKDDTRHEIMMMFVDPAQQGSGIGRTFLQALLSGPMQELPVLCSTTQPASTRMMALLRRAGFEQKIETSDGIYWEKANRADAPTLPSKKSIGGAPAAKPVALTGGTPLALPPIDLLALTDEPVLITPPVLSHTSYQAVDTHPVQNSDSAEPAPPQSETQEAEAQGSETRGSATRGSETPEAEPATPPEPPPPGTALVPVPSPPLPNETSVEAAGDDPASPEILAENTAADDQTAALPKPPDDFGTPRSADQRERGKKWARSLFALPAEQPDVAAEPEPVDRPGPVPDTTRYYLEAVVDMPEDLMLATLTTIRKKLGALPNAKLPPLDRYQLDAFNKKDLENMNIVELAALSAQLIRLARDQLSEIDRLKISAKRSR